MVSIVTSASVFLGFAKRCFDCWVTVEVVASSEGLNFATLNSRNNLHMSLQKKLLFAPITINEWM